MNNGIWGKNVYSNIINSYMKTPGSSKIKGTLLEVNENKNKIKLNIGSEKALDIILKNPLDAQTGDTVVIDRSNIVESKLTTLDDTSLEKDMTVENSLGKYDYILKSLGIPAKESSLEAVESLDHHGVDITKGNILSFMSAKEQLSSISEKLDYDTVIKLKDKDIDFEKESLQKVLQELEGVKTEKKSFSILKFLGLKKDMTTDEAEKIATDIYGNKMGKDVTDIIKALDKAGVKITKESIDNVNRIFNKLHNIQEIEDTTIIDTVKNKIEASIDNLYKLKNAITKGTLKIEEKLGQMATKAYGAYNSGASQVTEVDLKQIEGDIEVRLEEMGVKVTEDLVRLAKDVIARGLDLTKENLDRIAAIKGSIVELNASLDYEKAAILMASGIEIEKSDMVQLMTMVNSISDVQGSNIIEGLDRLELLQLIETLDIKAMAMHTKLGLPATLESLNITQSMMDGDITADEWLSKLQILDGFDDIATDIKKEDVISILRNLNSTEILMEIDSRATAYLKANGGKLGSIMEESYGKEIVTALLQNEIPLTTTNIQELYMLKKALDRVGDNLTADSIQIAKEEGAVVEKLTLNKLDNMLTEIIKSSNGKGEDLKTILETTPAADEAVEKMKSMVDALKQITPERRDSILSLLMKNAMPLTLKEVQNLSFFLENDRQIGQQLNEILELIGKNSNEDILKLAEDLKTGLMNINADIKEGKQLGQRPYDEFSRILRELEDKSNHLTSTERSALQKSGEKLLNSLELQLHLNREDTLLQLPLMMGHQFKNLQMYVMRDKKGSKKIDPKNMSVLLNFDTNNMGNMNIYVGVHYKNIVMKMGLENKEDQSLIEDYSKELKKYLEDLGYDLKELSFRIDNDNNILSMTKETEGNHRTMNKLLDIKI